MRVGKMPHFQAMVLLTNLLFFCRLCGELKLYRCECIAHDKCNSDKTGEGGRLSNQIGLSESLSCHFFAFLINLL